MFKLRLKMYKAISNFICDGICKKVGEVLNDSDLDALKNRIDLLIESKLIEEIKSESPTVVSEPASDVEVAESMNEATESEKIIDIKSSQKSKKKSKG